MMNKSIKPTLAFLLTLFLFSSCEEDFDIITEYKDQTVIYAFLEHSDPWSTDNQDTNWVVVNKAFLGDAKLSDMVSVADSVNYPDYDVLSVSLQRIESLDPKSKAIGDPIYLDYTAHYKEVGIFAGDNNIVFYTTEPLMYYQNTDQTPEPNPDDEYIYRISVKKPGQEEVYATTKMIRGITENKPLTNAPNSRRLNMSSTFPGYTFDVYFYPNPDARLYGLFIRTYFYEKRTDGQIYLDYVEYKHPLEVMQDKYPSSTQKNMISVQPVSYYNSFNSQLRDTNGVVWRVPKILNKTGLEETHRVGFSLGSHETYVYNQVTMPSDGIVQEKPTYTNVVNGLGLFTSKWNFYRDQFSMVDGTIDSLHRGVSTKHLKFESKSFTYEINSTIHRNDVIKRRN